MYNFSEFIIILAGGISFVLMFRLQRKFFSGQYYELSRRVFGRGVTIRMMLIRVIMIFLYSYIFYSITNSENIVISGVFLGSFLIVWPVLLNPSTFDVQEAGQYEKNVTNVRPIGWFLLLISYLLFIMSSVFIAYTGVSFGDYIVSKTLESFKSWLSSAWWLLIVAILFSKVSELLENILEKDILERRNKLNKYDDNDEQ